jgi:hypothetical protein
MSWLSNLFHPSRRSQTIPVQLPAPTRPGMPTSPSIPTAPTRPVDQGSFPTRPMSSLVPAQPFRRSMRVSESLRELTQKAKSGTAAQAEIHAANANLEKFNFNYHTGKSREANLLSAPPGNKLHLTVTVSVSGHTQEAMKFAKDPNQRFLVEVKPPNGPAVTMTVAKADTQDAVYAVAQDIEIDVSQKGTYLVSAWPEGSARVGGYVEGRQYRLHVGQENFYNPAADRAKARQMQSLFSPAESAAHKYLAAKRKEEGMFISPAHKEAAIAATHQALLDAQAAARTAGGSFDSKTGKFVPPTLPTPYQEA